MLTIAPQLLATAALFALMACGSNHPQPDAPAQTAPVLPVEAAPELQEAVGSTVDVAVRDTVILRAGAEIHIDHGQFRLVPNGDYVDLEDLSTFQVYVDELIVRVPADQLVNGVDTERTPIKNLSMHADGERFVIAGHLNALGLPFEVEIEPGVTPDGRLALDLLDVQILEVGIKPFLSFLEKQLKIAPGLVVIEDGVLYLDLEDSDKLPELHIAFSGAELVRADLVARVGSPAMPEGEGSFVVLAGGVFHSKGSMLFDSELTLMARDQGQLTLGPDFARQMQDGFVKPGEGNKMTIHLDPPEPTDGPPTKRGRATATQAPAK